MEEIKRYYKLTLRHGGGENDLSVDYFDDLGKLIIEAYHLGVECVSVVADCTEISELEYNENYLPV